MLQRNNLLPAIAVIALLVSGCAVDSTVPVSPIRIPVELHSGMPTISVGIAGKTLKLFVDSAGYNAIALTGPELLRVPVNYSGESTRSTNASGEIYESRRFIAPDVVLGGVVIGDLDGSEFVFPAAAAPPDRNGYIGFALLGRFLVVVDYPDHEIRLYPSGSTAAFSRECGAKQFDIDIVDGVAQSVAHTSAGSLVFSWDTGSTRSVIRPSAVGMTAADAKAALVTRTHRMSRFVLGTKDAGPQDFVVIDYAGIGVDGVLGTDFFRARAVCLDFPQGAGAFR